MSFKYSCFDDESVVPEGLKSEACNKRTIFDVYDKHNKGKINPRYSLEICCPRDVGIVSITRTLVGNEKSPKPAMFNLPLRQFNSEFYDRRHLKHLRIKSNCQVCLL